MEVRACNTPPCASKPKKGDCIFNDWQSWTAPTCTGLCERARTPKEIGAHGGDLCTGHMVETKSCDSQCDTPEDCRFSQWTQWTHCTTPTSQRLRRRSVLEMAHAGGIGCR